MREPRRIPLDREPVERRIGDEGGLGNRGRKTRRATQPSIRRRIGRTRRIEAVHAETTQTREPGLEILVQELADIVAGQHALVGEEPRIARCQPLGVRAGVGVAEQCRRKPALARLQRHVRVPPVERRAVHDAAVIMEVKTGMQARAGRAAGRGHRMVPAEEHTVPGQPVEIGRAHHRMAERAERVAAPLVRGDQQDIRRLFHRLTPRREPDADGDAAGSDRSRRASASRRRRSGAASR